MYQFFLESREDQAYHDRALQDRIEAQGRAVDLVIGGIAAAVAATGRAGRAGLAHLARAHAVRRRRRLAIRELSRLDDRLLRDIGVARGDIYSIAAELGDHDEAFATPAPAARPAHADRVPGRAAEPAATPAAAPAAAPALRLDLGCLGRKPASDVTGLAA